ncbi:MAG: DUF4166 domain-containing protein [Pseudomonadota bacterium]
MSAEGAPASAAPSLYQRALGASYARLPAAVQHFHALRGHTVLQGWVETEAPGSAWAWLLAMTLGTPRRATRGALRFELHSTPEAERWTRHFPARTMCSTLRLVDGRIVERLGATRLTFRLGAEPTTLRMSLTSLRFLGLPCPRWLLPQVVAEESGGDGQLHFRVSATLPLIGQVAGYRGHLDLPRKEAAP